MAQVEIGRMVRFWDDVGSPSFNSDAIIGSIICYTKSWRDFEKSSFPAIFQVSAFPPCNYRWHCDVSGWNSEQQANKKRQYYDRTLHRWLQELDGFYAGRNDACVRNKL